MKYLIVPQNNSLSHVAKALAIRVGLIERGHEVLVAVGRRWEPYLDALGIAGAVLPDIQESDGAGFPSVAWFRDRRAVRQVIEEERQLIEAYRPDRVIGVFRFTLKAATRQAGVPYISLACGCMLPGACDSLGYAPGETGARQQQELMSGFFRYAGLCLSRAAADLALPPVDDAREMLVGERSFLWDFPEFFQAPEFAGCSHAGAIPWERWPVVGEGWERFTTWRNRPLAVLSFGTCVGNPGVARRLAAVLADLGYHVLLAAGGQRGMVPDIAVAPWLTVCHFAPLHLLWPKVSLLVSHGGQMSIFEALSHGVPVAVMPFQPEQAHNGVCLEQLGCGRRLVPGRPFLGNPAVYEEALLERGDAALAEVFSSLLSATTAQRIEETRQVMQRCQGLQGLLAELESF